MRDGPVHLLGARHANVQDVRTRVHRATRGGPRECGTGRAGVEANNNGTRAEVLRHGAPDPVGGCLVDVDANFSTYVVGLRAR